MKKYLLKIALVLALALFVAPVQQELAAQCPMCRMTAESNLKNGGTAGRGLNAGILYMLAMPYLLVGAVGFWWWKNRKKEAADQPDDTYKVDKDNINYN